jgi:AbrB family looped-hinge helix DNA binding protein
MRLPDVATITSKRQLTLPARLVDKLGWRAGMKVSVEATSDPWSKIIIQPLEPSVGSTEASKKKP